MGGLCAMKWYNISLMLRKERGGEGRGGLCAMKWHVVVMSSDMNCRSGPGIGNGRSV